MKKTLIIVALIVESIILSYMSILSIAGYAIDKSIGIKTENKNYEEVISFYTDVHKESEYLYSKEYDDSNILILYSVINSPKCIINQNNEIENPYDTKEIAIQVILFNCDDSFHKDKGFIEVFLDDNSSFKINFSNTDNESSAHFLHDYYSCLEYGFLYVPIYYSDINSLDKCISRIDIYNGNEDLKYNIDLSSSNISFNSSFYNDFMDVVSDYNDFVIGYYNGEELVGYQIYNQGVVDKTDKIFEKAMELGYKVQDEPTFVFKEARFILLTMLAIFIILLVNLSIYLIIRRIQNKKRKRLLNTELEYGKH